MMLTRSESGAASGAHVVLIVDDVPENLAVLSDARDEASHTVLVATDGARALERLVLVMTGLTDTAQDGCAGVDCPGLNE